jgi:hypothetical protein
MLRREEVRPQPDGARRDCVERAGRRHPVADAQRLFASERPAQFLRQRAGSAIRVNITASTSADAMSKRLWRKSIFHNALDDADERELRAWAAACRSSRS